MKHILHVPCRVDRGEVIYLIFMDTSRLVSVVLALVFFIVAYFGFGVSGEDAFFFVLYLLACITLIWYGDELGSMTGVRFGSIARPVVTKPTPGKIVRFFGWGMLLLPLVLVMGKLLSIF